MTSLLPYDLLEIWERGVDCAPVEQALLLLQASLPQAAADELEKMTVGKRDRHLLNLRKLTFGSQIAGLAACPACRERLEIAFDLDLLHTDDSNRLESESQSVEDTAVCLPFDSYEVTFRLPDSRDLLTLAGPVDPISARRRLMESCIIRVQKDDTEIPVECLPASVGDSIAEQMKLKDPIADLVLDAVCPACRHHWQILFDIVSFFWSEINAWAVRRMREIHILASAYGWREDEILALSDRRRQHYLEMIGA